MWGEIFKEGLKIVGMNLLKGRDSGGGSSAGLEPDYVDFDEYDMAMLKPEDVTAIEKAKVSNYITYQKFWNDRLLQYLNMARTIK